MHETEPKHWFDDSATPVCSAERDAQPFLMPISLLLILPVMMGMAIAQAPDH